MLVLAIEAATELVGAALVTDSGPLGETWVTGRRRHAETLAPMITDLLHRSATSLSDVTAVAVDVGPGLFTGLRVGIATAKGLAFGLGIGVVPVTSLAALAHAAFDWGNAAGAEPGADGNGRAHAVEVVPVVDARRGEVFAARFGPPPAGSRLPLELDEPRRYRPEELVTTLAELARRAPGTRLLCPGDGALRYRDALGTVPGVQVAGDVVPGPLPVSVGLVGRDLLAAGWGARDAASVEAVYLRDADARINWVTRSGART